MATLVEQLKEMLKTDRDSFTLSRDELMSLVGKRQKKQRDPLKPKRGRSSYFCFKDSDQARAKFSEEMPEFWNSELNRPMKVSEMTKFASKLWKAMEDEDRQPFVEMAKKEKEAYYAKLSEYNPIQISDGVDESMDLPEGWSGPFTGYYLAANADGRKTYPTLSQAIKVAESVDSCMGITRNSKGRFSLRKMDGEKPIATNKGDTSWVKGDCSLEVLENEIDEDESEGEDTPEVVQWNGHLVDEKTGDVYDLKKFTEDGEVVVIGRREPNLVDGELELA